MTEQQLDTRVLASHEGLILESVGHVRNRFMIDSTETDGRFGLLQHLFEPKALAAPMHRHHDEDEYTYILTGRIGAILGGQEVLGGPGDLIFKPRGQWHTFWNAGDESAVVMEIISPSGLEEFFKSFAELTGPVDPIELKEKAAAVAHVDIDLDATFPIIQRHGLIF